MESYVRNLSLYPTELRGQVEVSSLYHRNIWPSPPKCQKYLNRFTVMAVRNRRLPFQCRDWCHQYLRLNNARWRGRGENGCQTGRRPLVVSETQGRGPDLIYRYHPNNNAVQKMASQQNAGRDKDQLKNPRQQSLAKYW